MGKLALHTARWVLGLIFFGAGALKITEAQHFAHAVQNYQLTSWMGSMLIAFYLPWLEIVAAVALLTQRLYRGALTSLSALTLLFLGAIISAWWRDLDISCGCFGPELNHTNYPLHLVADLALLAILLVLAMVERRHPSQPAQPRVSHI